MKILAGIIIFLNLTTFSFATERGVKRVKVPLTPKNAAIQAVYFLTEELTRTPLNVEIGSLTLEKTEASSEFADAFLDDIRDELLKNESDYKHVERRKITPKEMRGLIFKPSKPKPGDDEPIDVILEGSYRETKEKIYVNLRLIEKEKQDTISKSEVSIAKDQIRLPFKPDNEGQLSENQSILDNLPKELVFYVNMKKGEKAVYREGEPFEFMVIANKDVYLHNYFLQADGIIKKLDAGKFYKGKKEDYLPKRENEEPEWWISCNPLCGLEQLIVLATDKPISLNISTSEGKIWSLNEFLELLLKEIDSVKNPYQKTVSVFHFTTLRKNNFKQYISE